MLLPMTCIDLPWVLTPLAPVANDPSNAIRDYP
jgi:hypothetical protein